MPVFPPDIVKEKKFDIIVITIDLNAKGGLKICRAIKNSWCIMELKAIR
jgi:DNA-binding response OmpR family regulator